MLDIRQRTGYLFLAVMVGHVILISAQVPTKTGVPVLEGVTFGIFSRVQRATAGIVGGVRNSWGNYVALRGARVENEALHKQVADLEVRLQEQRALAARAVRLQELMDLKTNTSLPTIAAEIIAGNPNPGMMTVTIDRGSADGVQANMAVISPKGIVGRVVGNPASHAARVQLIMDRSAAAGAIGERSRAGGMVVGIDGDPPLRMDLVSNLADINPGDVIVTSGVDGIYPKGFAIGTVEKSERGSKLYRAITVRPVVDFSSLEEVLVVLVPAHGATSDRAAPATPAAASGAKPK
ncbi:MAG TPA: rod shape-determining protein MreC [Vicinamibacterales bacterium]|jgi:rod shape-determining protein MreC|nr:rod shape-determining protein MreC [Vicinamibacterales bacterium]